VLGKTYDQENCSAARALELVGERWSLLIIRDALFRNITRFAEFQRSLGVATNVLSSRLDGFVAAGLMQGRTYSNHEDHYEYVLTDKGRDLAAVVIALTTWGDRWAAPNGPPIVYRHDGCGGQIDTGLVCSRCAQQVPVIEIEAEPGPGSHSGATQSSASRRVKKRRSASVAASDSARS